MKIKIYKRKKGFAFGNLEQIHYKWYEIDIGFFVLSVRFEN